MNIFKRIKDALGTMKSLYYNDPQSAFGHCGQNVMIELPTKINHPENIFIDDDVAIRGFFTFISHTGKLFIKSHCDISQRLTVVTGNHTVKPPLDKWQVECNHTSLGDAEKDTTIEEDVWIGISVTIMPGVTIGRGSIIGACSVVTKSIPPYSIAVGNPCKVIRKKFTKEEITVRETTLYPPQLRMSAEQIEELFK